MATEAAAVATGYSHTCAMTSGGGVKCWGYNGYGELGDGTWTGRATPGEVIGLTSGVVAVAVGGNHTCVVTSGGGVKCWGRNADGQLGDGTTKSRPLPGDVSGLTGGVVAIAAGSFHTCAVTSEEALKCWGNNDRGQLGDGTTTDRPAPVNVSGLTSGVIGVSAGINHTCAVTTAGGAKCWGWNSAGQVGDGTTTDRTTPRDVVGLTTGTEAVAASGAHSCALTSGGGVKCWGDNYAGQLGDGTTTPRSAPQDVIGLTSGTVVVAPGSSHTCALTSGGGVKCWGGNFDGQLGDGTLVPRSVPGDVSGLTAGVAAVGRAGSTHVCAVTTVGAVRCWGDNRHGQLGDATVTYRSTPRDATGLAGGAVAVGVGGFHTCAVTTAGGVKCWGLNASGQLGHSEPWQSIPNDVGGLASGVVAVAAGSYHSCALTNGGGLKCWGRSAEGQLGNNSTAPWQSIPQDVVGLGSGVVAVTAGGYHTCAVTGAGGLKCWGRNDFGQLGNGTTALRSTPGDVSGLTSGVVAVSAGGSHTCAITSAGGVRCWGQNSEGQLGDGTTAPWRTTPVDVSGLASGVAMVAAGGIHSCALCAAGGVKCWGLNSSGQLGDGTTTRRLTPVDVVGLTSGALSVTARFAHTCAVTSDGGATCWGDNDYGQLGDGTLVPRSTPAGVNLLAGGVGVVVAGGYHSCALTSTADIKCWGNDEDGQLGNGRWLMRPRPYVVKGFGPPVTFADFTGDGRADHVVFQPSTGTWSVRNVGSWAFGAPGDVPVVGDYDGNGRADIAVYRAATGMWAVKDVVLEATALAATCGTGSELCDQTRSAAGEVQFGTRGDVPVPADYDGDGRTDIAVYRPATGSWHVRGLPGMVRWGGRGDTPVPADYDGDGRAEFAVYRPATGAWHVRDLGVWTYGLATDIPVPADYDGDGDADIAVFRPPSGTWYVRGQGCWQFGTEGDVPVPLDLDADGRVELVVYRPSTSTWYSLAPADGATTTVAFGTLGDVPAAMRPTVTLRTVAGDVDGDGKADVSIFRPWTTTWWLTESESGAVRGVTWGAAGDVRVPADYDGDGRMDVAVWRPGSPATWHVARSTTGYTTSLAVTWGSSAAGDVPVRGDFDGDGWTDIGVWRAPTGAWYVLTSATDFAAALPVVSWGSGGASDQPVPADYDGDGTDDLAVWRPGNGTWYVRLSSGGSLQVAWGSGALGDQALPGDYDGDGKADLALWRPTNGQWYILRSSSGYTNYLGLQWGTTGDTMVPADYDGDGKLDVGIFRPSTGTWYVRTSSSNFVSVWQRVWGTAGDFAVTGR